MGARRGTWKEGFFTEDPEGYLKEGSGNGHLSIGDPLGTMEGAGAILLGTLRESRIMFYRDKLDCWRLREVCERRLWKRVNLSFWVSLGNWKEGLFYWVLWETEEGLW
jgi:hypothetical protein